MYASIKRFPASCRFYSQGNCRAGQECHFAHILPFNDSPNTDTVNKNKSISIQDLASVQAAIRKSELDQLDKSYSSWIQTTIEKDYNTLIDLILPIENKEDLKVHLIVPHNYPDAHCTLQLQDVDLSAQAKSDFQAAFEDEEWHHKRHKSLVQQLGWLISHFSSL